MKSRLHREIEAYLAKGRYPMHMPGHKRRLHPDADLPYDWDLTEVDGVDDLHHADGILLEAMERTADLCSADRSWYLVNGSTSGNLAGVFACAPRNSEIIMARNCHRSLFHIVQLRGLHVHWLMPEIDEEYGIQGCITPASVMDMLERYPDSKAVVLVSPTYEGVISDIRGIAEIAHAHGVPVFVDEAHGAHLGLFEEAGFVRSAIQCGADLSVQSFHKTLPSMTQTAVLHMKSDLVDAKKVEQGIDIFETSSPSYPLLVSLDACTEYLKEHGREDFMKWRETLARFDEMISALKYLRVLCHMGDRAENHSFFAFDPSRLLINGKKAGMSGGEIQKILREQYGFELEMSMDRNALAMTGPGDDPNEIFRLAEALKEMDQNIQEGNRESTDVSATLHDLPETVMSIAEAMDEEGSVIRINEAAGRTVREYVYCYPPGIPLLIPGEMISQKMADTLAELAEEGVNLHFTESGDEPDTVCVI